MSATLEEIAGRTFDYVVIGGGTAGLTVAARLAEDPTTTVAVLEAGSVRLDDPQINIPAQFGKHFGDPTYDWDFHTVPQQYANGRSFSWSRGKVLGGSSAINFYVWNNPPIQDIDAWEKLGNPGWNWVRFAECLKKVESFASPEEEHTAKYKLTFDPVMHGTDGPLKILFPGLIKEWEVPFQETLKKTGIKYAKDPYNGDPVGTWMAASTLDGNYTRSYAATAFFKPNADKPNFRVLCDALVHRIITKSDDQSGTSSGAVRAEAVEFEHGGRIYSVLVSKEVILSAGALKSPQILELSGIGDPRILTPLGIKTVIDLPGVGSNMQEHIFGSVVFELDPKLGYEALDALADKNYAAAQQALHAEGKGLYRLCLSGFTFVPLSAVTSPEVAHNLVARQRQRIEERVNNGELPTGLKDQYMLQLAEFEKGCSADCEIISFPGYFGAGTPEAGKAYFSIFYASNHLFSRGTVHVKSRNPHVQPDMDPHYFEEELDLQVMAVTAEFIRGLQELEPFKSIIAKEVIPGSACTTDEEVKEFVKDNFGTTYHTAGTLSMLPRSHNGVVDTNLRIYGTANIRVADLSIVPLHIAAHTQSTAYAIGEQAAGIIRGWILEVK